MADTKQFRKMIRANKNLPQYFKDLILWKLLRGTVTQLWIRRMSKNIRHIEYQIKKKP